jgi:alginate O-acetyltransferase complex protein AlgI
MVFASPLFLFIFLPITLIVYFITPKKLKNFWLMLVSIAFYSWGGGNYALIILVSILFNYIIGIQIGKFQKGDKKKKLWLILGLILNFSILGYFKYYNFFISNLVKVGNIFSPGFTLNTETILLPVGISFFTFQIVSYVIDVYREDVAPQRNIINLALYILLFPQLIAGPIVRYIDVEKQINNRKVTMDKFNYGIQRFIVGFSKKVLISNTAGFVADYIFNAHEFYNDMALTWIGVICYALQIYHDFSGYSDMAIGLGRMFGFDFLENFNYPYISKSIKEFWHRWHISLSTWFRDYLYIPLGGSRCGKLATYRNLLIVFFATGLWHGASWNFIVWGLFYGVFLILERGAFGKFIDRMPTALQRIYTLVIVLIAWVFFRAENLGLALNFIKGMFSFNFKGFYLIYNAIDTQVITFLLLGIIFSTPIAKLIGDYLKEKLRSIKVVLELLWSLGLAAMFYISILYMTGSFYNPFIYFRF